MQWVSNPLPSIFLIALLVLPILILLFILRPAHKSRHRRNINQSYKAIQTLRSFSGGERNARVMVYLRRCDPYVFEEILLSALQQHGIDIRRNDRYSGDGGIDGQCVIEGQHFLIQAKRYQGYINSRHVQDFVQVLKPHQGGLFIHTGKTGPQSRRQRLDRVAIISGEWLVKLVLGELTQSELIYCINSATASSRRYPSSMGALKATGG